jgi:hypothetical protein
MILGILADLFWLLMCFVVGGLILIAATFIGCVVYIFIHNAINIVKKNCKKGD